MLFVFLTLVSLSSAVELRQAIVAMMNRKDELEEQNTYVGIFFWPCARTHVCMHALAVARRYLMISVYKMVVVDLLLMNQITIVIDSCHL